MKGETLLSLPELALVMVLFSAAVVGVVIYGFFAFKRWEKREAIRRGRQIAMAHLDPECAELPKRNADDTVIQ